MGNNSKKISNYFPKHKFILLSFFSVLVGGLVYLLFRQTEPVFFSWFSGSPIERWIPVLRKESVVVGQFLPQWIVFSLPNALWAFAYTLIVLGIWNHSNSHIKYFWFLSIPALVFGMEILQFTENLPGTFCMQDIVGGATGIMLGFIVINIYKIKDSYEKSNF